MVTDLKIVRVGWVVGNAFNDFTLGQQHTSEVPMKNSQESFYGNIDIVEFYGATEVNCTIAVRLSNFRFILSSKTTKFYCEILKTQSLSFAHGMGNLDSQLPVSSLFIS